MDKENLFEENEVNETNKSKQHQNESAASAPCDVPEYDIDVESDECAKTIEFTALSSAAAKKFQSRKRRSRSLPLIVTLASVAFLLCTLFISSAFIRIGGSTIWEILGSLGEGYTPSVGTDVPFVTGEDDPQYHPDVDGYDRKDGVYNFLVGGLDRISYLSDVLMLVTLDTNEHTVHVTQIPRDLYINIGSGAGFHKINSYFIYCMNTADWSLPTEQKMALSADGLMKFLEANLSINIDGYVFTTLDGFREIVDVFDGVEVDVPFDMQYYDEEQGLYINLKKGLQVLDGEKAEQFIRFRSGLLEGDLGRVKTQKIFMSAFVKKIKTELTASRLVDLVSTASEHVITSVSTADCVYYAKELFKIDMENVGFFTLSGVSTFGDGAWYYVMNRADAITVMNAIHNVYKTPVTSSVFDRERVFTNVYSDEINAIYDAAPTKDLLDSILSSSAINDSSINIPHT